MNILKNKKVLLKLNQIAKKYDFLVFILFGSRSKNNFTDKSDFDFAFYTKKTMSYKKELKIYNELVSLLDYDKIDLVNISKKSKIF